MSLPNSTLHRSIPVNDSYKPIFTTAFLTKQSTYNNDILLLLTITQLFSYELTENDHSLINASYRTQSYIYTCIQARVHHVFANNTFSQLTTVTENIQIVYNYLGRRVWLSQWKPGGETISSSPCFQPERIVNRLSFTSAIVLML